MKVLLPALLAVILFRASVTHAADASEIGNELPLAVADSQGTENKNHLPLYELGVGVGTLYAPDYPGSNHNSLWTLPLPFFVYRGDVFRSDKEGGMRARWSLGDSTEFYFSAGGGLPSSSTAGDARDGMPDLEWLGEVGPAVSFRLMKAESGDGHQIQHSVADGGLDELETRRVERRHAGTVSHHRSTPRVFKNGGIFAMLTSDFATEAYMDYFYGVDPQFARPDRASYSARGGYLQSTLTLGAAYGIPKWNIQIFAFGSFDELAGAANVDSPLLRRQSEWTGGLVVAWEFLKGSVKAGDATARPPVPSTVP